MFTARANAALRFGSRTRHLLGTHPRVEPSAVNNPSATPASLRLVPSACAFFEILAALSYPIFGNKLVTSMSELRMSASMRSRSGSTPRTQFLVKLIAESESNAMLLRLLCAMSGFATLS